MTCILGIDPGLSGALAFYYPDHPRHVVAHDMPVVDSNVDGANLADIVRRLAPDRAVVELVGAMPGQGVSSMFKFGRAYGIAIGVLNGLGVPFELVSPAKWKRHFGLTSDKEKSRLRALQTFTDDPGLFKLKKHDGRAEAALLALYGARTLSNGLAQAGGVTAPVT